MALTISQISHLHCSSNKGYKRLKFGSEFFIIDLIMIDNDLPQADPIDSQEVLCMSVLKPSSMFHRTELSDEVTLATSSATDLPCRHNSSNMFVILLPKSWSWSLTAFLFSDCDALAVGDVALGRIDPEGFAFDSAGISLETADHSSSSSSSSSLFLGLSDTDALHLLFDQSWWKPDSIIQFHRIKFFDKCQQSNGMILSWI